MRSGRQVAASMPAHVRLFPRRLGDAQGQRQHAARCAAGIAASHRVGRAQLRPRLRPPGTDWGAVGVGVGAKAPAPSWPDPCDDGPSSAAGRRVPEDRAGGSRTLERKGNGQPFVSYALARHARRALLSDGARRFAGRPRRWCVPRTRRSTTYVSGAAPTSVCGAALARRLVRLLPPSGRTRSWRTAQAGLPSGYWRPRVRSPARAASAQRQGTTT